MACNGPYAESWQFAAFFCTSSLLSGTDDSGGAANPSLSDSTADFKTAGIQPNAGMVLYNTTTGLSGPVTAVSTTALTATGVTWSDGDAWRIVAIDGEEISTIGHYLTIAASDIHVALAASGACDCSLASWADGYLSKLNIIDAAAYYQCPCGQPTMTDEMRGRYLDWCVDQLSLLREGKLEVCDGETGADFPAIGWAEQSLTDFATAEIIYNAELRS
jgi:hypothetical protein